MGASVPNPCYEIEIRGPLESDRERVRLENALKVLGATSASPRTLRQSYIFEQQDGKLDLRLRRAEAGPELVLKAGSERLATARWKHTIRLHPSLALEELQSFLAAYGYVSGHIIRRHYSTYFLSPTSPAFGFKVIIAEVPEWPQYNYFEIERAVVDAETIPVAVKQVHEMAEQLGVRCWTKEEYHEYLRTLNEKKVDLPYEYKSAQPWASLLAQDSNDPDE